MFETICIFHGDNRMQLKTRQETAAIISSKEPLPLLLPSYAKWVSLVTPCEYTRWIKSTIRGFLKFYMLMTAYHYPSSNGFHAPHLTSYLAASYGGTLSR